MLSNMPIYQNELSIQNYFENHKKHIVIALKEFLDTAKRQTSHISSYHTQVYSQVYPFIMGGKMIRGGLVMLTAEMFGKKPDYDVYNIASAIELFQSFFLIHDDIMDNDYLRRGEKTIFAQYLENQQVKNGTEYAKSMGICVGDIVLFLGLNLLNLNCFPVDTRFSLIHLLSIELVKVGFAQMEDVSGGYKNIELSIAEIENIYRYKTARYTFSLPLMSGAIITKQSKKTIQSLEQLGEEMGLLFQIHDDELNLFEDNKKTGKSVGSDITQNKKTLLRYFLFKKASQNDKKKLLEIFGNPHFNLTMPKELKNLCLKYGVTEDLAKIKSVHRLRSKKIISHLPITEVNKKMLIALLDFISTRSK